MSNIKVVDELITFGGWNQGVVMHNPGLTPPVNPVIGEMYIDESISPGHHRKWNGTYWEYVNGLVQGGQKNITNQSQYVYFPIPFNEITSVVAIPMEYPRYCDIYIMTPTYFRIKLYNELEAFNVGNILYIAIGK